MHRRFCLIANPVSGTANRRTMVEALRDGLAAAGREAEICWTEGPGDATRLARETEAEVAVAVGGDGTLREVAEGLRERPVVLAAVPAGTANVLAHELQLPWETDAQLRMLLAGRVHHLDGGVCNGERFLLMIGAGLDGAVTHAHTRAASGHNSYLRYVKPVLETVRDMPLHPLRVTVDDTPMPAGIMSAVVGNVRGFGNVFEAVSNARPDDGVLDVIGLTGRNRLAWTGYLVAALARKLHEMPGAHSARGVRVHIESDEPVPMQRDGDPYGFTPADITVEPGAVPILVP